MCISNYFVVYETNYFIKVRNAYDVIQNRCFHLTITSTTIFSAFHYAVVPTYLFVTIISISTTKGAQNRYSRNEYMIHQLPVG